MAPPMKSKLKAKSTAAAAALSRKRKRIANAAGSLEDIDIVGGMEDDVGYDSGDSTISESRAALLKLKLEKDASDKKGDKQIDKQVDQKSASEKQDDKKVTNVKKVIKKVDRQSHDTVKVIVRQESEIFHGVKSKEPTDLDNHPCHLLLEVNVIPPPGVGTQNDSSYRNILLQAVPGSQLKIVGDVVIDSDNKAQLTTGAGKTSADHNGRIRMEIPNVSMISIGYTHAERIIVLWVHGESGWLQINPSEDYRIIYEDMRKAIAFRFGIEQYYYGDPRQKIHQSEDDEIYDVLKSCAAFNVGDGAVDVECILRCKYYQKFFLSQMVQMDIENGGGVAKGSLLYKWLLRGTFVLSPLANGGRFAREPFAVDYATSPVADGHLSEDEVDTNPAADNDPSTEAVPKMNKPFHGPYLSQQFPQGVPAKGSLPEHFAALICHAVESKRCPDAKKKLTHAQIHNAIYRDFNTGNPLVVSKTLLHYFGQATIKFLPLEFKDYPFWDSLNQPRKEFAYYEGLNLHPTGRDGKIYPAEDGIACQSRFEKAIGPEGLKRRTKQNNNRMEKSAAKAAKGAASLFNDVTESSESGAPPAKKRGRLAKVSKEIDAITEPPPNHTAFADMSDNQRSKHVLATVLTIGARLDAVNVASDNNSIGGVEPRPAGGRVRSSRRLGL
ncbi:uncharacterized protein RAG0_10036 [Rhynchosporium agropyri]|uniref:Uncharacterized protein n=1 Tax=Rhynchosporium agropyri TaxID=914238 RepID=A0A1E1L0Z8_9HELO|nr:uncharacterized protein RAG0_10036 [Rhynchosporium agropyri]